MKIVFANGRRPYPLFNGGDGISTHDVAIRLHKDGHEISAIGKINNPDFPESPLKVKRQLENFGVHLDFYSPEQIEYRHTKSYRCVMYRDELFEEYLEYEFKSNRPDVVLTQLNYSHRVVNITSKLKIKTIHFIHDHHSFNYLPINVGKNISHVVFNGVNTQKHFAHLLPCHYSVIYPPIRIQNYKVQKNTRRHLTMINPTFEKGGKLLMEIIPQLPKEKFLIVSGWKGVSPDFYKFKNVKVLSRQYDMRKVYSKTKILLVPSQWEEAFGRVVPEAMVNRIPVIASRVGGLPESVGRGGILIDDFVSYRKWCDAITKLLNDQTLYRRLGNEGYKHAQKFDFEKVYSQLTELFNYVHRS